MTRRIPLVFPNFLTHKTVAAAMLLEEDMKGAFVFSAGSISSMQVLGGFAQLVRGSVSLGIPEGPEDEKFSMIDYDHGYVPEEGELNEDRSGNPPIR